MTKVGWRDFIVWQCTFWHNLMFNPGLNENIEVLLFTPITTGVKRSN